MPSRPGFISQLDPSVHQLCHEIRIMTLSFGIPVLSRFHCLSGNDLSIAVLYRIHLTLKFQ